MSNKEPQSTQNTIEENNIQENDTYQIISSKPFPLNIRNWYPDIPFEKILEKIPNTQYPIRIAQYNILCDSLLPVSTRILEEDLKK